MDVRLIQKWQSVLMRIVSFVLILICPVVIYATLEDDLLSAAAKGDIKGVKRTLKNKVDINARGKFGETALMYAAANGYLEIAKVLLAAGADIDAMTNNGNTALSIALDSYNEEIARLIIGRHNERKPRERLKVSGAELLESYEPDLLREIREDIAIAMNRFPPRNVFFGSKNRHRVTTIEPVGVLYLFNPFSNRHRQIRIHNFGLNDESVEIVFRNAPGVAVKTPQIHQYAKVPAGAELSTPLEFAFSDLTPGKTYELTATIRASDGYVHDTIQVLIFMADGELAKPYFDERFDEPMSYQNQISYTSPWAEVPFQHALWDSGENTFRGITIRVHRFANPLQFYSNFHQERYNPIADFKLSTQLSVSTSNILDFARAKDLFPLYESGDLGDGITCLLPLSDGNWWHYQVQQDGKTSEVKLKINDPEVIITNDGYHLSWRFQWVSLDGNTVQSRGEIIQADAAAAGADGSVYFYLPEKKGLYPFINQYLSLGEKIDDLIVMDISPYAFKEKQTRVVHLSDNV